MDNLSSGLVKRVLRTGRVVARSGGVTSVVRSFTKTARLSVGREVVMARYPSGKLYLVGRK